jgi:integrase
VAAVGHRLAFLLAAHAGLRAVEIRGLRRRDVEAFRPHDLRHVFVTALFRRGVAGPTVQALAGHAHLTTPPRYARIARMDLRAAIEQLAG